MEYIYVFLTIILISCPINCFNYLVFSPLFAHSHANFLAKIADALTDAGHNVTYLSPIVNEKFRDVKYVKSTKHVVYMEPSTALIQTNQKLQSDLSLYWEKDSTLFEMVPTFKNFLKFNPTFMESLRSSLDVLDSLKDRKYDVIISEHLAYSMLAVREYLNIPTILPVTSLTHETRLCESIGESTSPVFLTGALLNYSNEMTFIQRAYNTFVYIFEHLMLRMEPLESLVHSGKYLDIKEFAKAPVAFSNSNPLIDFPRPILPKSIPVGGMTINIDELRSKKVTEEFDHILEERPHTILVSFGSLFFAKDMPMSYKRNIANVMKSFSNVTFIWKYETSETEFANGIDNIHFRSWVPQTALLADSRLDAFFTHAGLGSVHELCYLGKPAIVCPIFGDQIRNAKMLTRHNGSIEISKFDLSNFKVVQDAINRILNDKSFKFNAELLATKLKKQPIHPKELLVKYAEFAAEFGEQPLSEPYFNKYSFFEYFLIDVAVTFLISILTILFIISSIVRYVFQSIFGSQKTKKE